MVQAEQADAALVVGVFDGLPQRCILLVRGVRARRGGVAREARAESRPTNEWLAERCKFGCRAIASHASKNGFSLLCAHWKMGLLVGFKLRLARSTVLRSRRPGPPTPALGRRAGGYK